MSTLKYKFSISEQHWIQKMFTLKYKNVILWQTNKQINPFYLFTYDNKKSVWPELEYITTDDPSLFGTLLFVSWSPLFDYTLYAETWV